MPPRIAIPVPHSGDPEYAERSLPQYERAVEIAGGTPVRIPLDKTPAAVMNLIERCDAVLLPGSKADVDPAKYNATRNEKTASADTRRDTVDELLLQDAYNMRKPILGICYGLQLACHLLGGIHQPFEHRLVERIVLVRAHHGDRCNAIGTNAHTNSVFAHAWQSTATHWRARIPMVDPST